MGVVPRVVRASWAQLAIGPIRLAAGVTCVLVAEALGARPSSAVIAFGAAIVVVAAFALQDPLRRIAGAEGERPTALPAGAVEETVAQMTRAMLFPSTVGLTLLAIIGLAVGRLTLAALLAGCLAGLGVAALVRGGVLLTDERRRGVAVLTDVHSRRVYERPL